MAKEVLKNAYIQWGTGSSEALEDWTTQLSGCTVPISIEEVESGVFGNNSQQSAAGLADIRVQFTFRPDADLVKMTKLLQKLGEEVPFEIRMKPSAVAVSSSNLKYTGRMLITASTIGGARGALTHETELDFRINGGLTITDGTTPFTVG